MTYTRSCGRPRARTSRSTGAMPVTMPVIMIAGALLVLGTGAIAAAFYLWPDRKPAVVANVADISNKIGDGVGNAIAQEFSASAEAANTGDTVILQQLTADPASPMTVHFASTAPRKTCYFFGCSRAQTDKERLRIFTAPFTDSVRRALQPGYRPRTRCSKISRR